MGTAVTVDVRDPEVPETAVDKAFRRLAAIDVRFSTYRDDSEVSRYGRGDIDDDHISAELRTVLQCARTSASAAAAPSTSAAIGRMA